MRTKSHCNIYEAEVENEGDFPGFLIDEGAKLSEELGEVADGRVCAFPLDAISRAGVAADILLKALAVFSRRVSGSWRCTGRAGGCGVRKALLATEGSCSLGLR